MALKSAQETKQENFISIEIVIGTIFYDRWFSHTILYIHKLSYTPRILSLHTKTNIYFVIFDIVVKKKKNKSNVV